MSRVLCPRLCMSPSGFFLLVIVLILGGFPSTSFVFAPPPPLVSALQATSYKLPDQTLLLVAEFSLSTTSRLSSLLPISCVVLCCLQPSSSLHHIAASYIPHPSPLHHPPPSHCLPCPLAYTTHRTRTLLRRRLSGTKSPPELYPLPNASALTTYGCGLPRKKAHITSVLSGRNSSLPPIPTPYLSPCSNAFRSASLSVLASQLRPGKHPPAEPEQSCGRTAAQA